MFNLKIVNRDDYEEVKSKARQCDFFKDKVERTGRDQMFESRHWQDENKRYKDTIKQILEAIHDEKQVNSYNSVTNFASRITNRVNNIIENNNINLEEDI